MEARAEAGLRYDVYDLYAGRCVWEGRMDGRGGGEAGSLAHNPTAPCSYGSCPYGARKGLPPAPPAQPQLPRRPLLAQAASASGAVDAADARSLAEGNSCTDTADLRRYLNTQAVQVWGGRGDGGERFCRHPSDAACPPPLPSHATAGCAARAAAPVGGVQ